MPTMRLTGLNQPSHGVAACCMQDIKAHQEGIGKFSTYFSTRQHGQGKAIFGRLAAAARINDIRRLQSYYTGTAVFKYRFQKHIRKLLCIINLEVSTTDLMDSEASGMPRALKLAK